MADEGGRSTMGKHAKKRNLTGPASLFVEQLAGAKEIRAYLTPEHYAACRRIVADPELGPSLRAIDHALSATSEVVTCGAAEMALRAGVPLAHAVAIAEELLDFTRDDKDHYGWEALVVLAYWPEDQAGWDELDAAAAGVRPPPSPLRGIRSTSPARSERRGELAFPPRAGRMSA